MVRNSSALDDGYIQPLGFYRVTLSQKKKLSLEVKNYQHIIKQLDLIDANDLLRSWPTFDEQMQILQKDRVNAEVSIWEKPRKLKAVWRKGKVEIG